jgi:hypothetical protein
MRLNQGAYPTNHNFSNFKLICKIFLQIGMCKMSYKFVKNQLYLIFTNLSRSLQKIGSKWLR